MGNMVPFRTPAQRMVRAGVLDGCAIVDLALDADATEHACVYWVIRADRTTGTYEVTVSGEHWRHILTRCGRFSPSETREERAAREAIAALLVELGEASFR